jgi:hypothetical protein
MTLMTSGVNATAHEKYALFILEIIQNPQMNFWMKYVYSVFNVKISSSY